MVEGMAATVGIAMNKVAENTTNVIVEKNRLFDMARTTVAIVILFSYSISVYMCSVETFLYEK